MGLPQSSASNSRNIDLNEIEKQQQELERRAEELERRERMLNAPTNG